MSVDFTWDLATHGLPGGHLELRETFEGCAARELLEETGIVVDPGEIRFLTATNQPDLEGRHYVTVFMGCRVHAGDGSGSGSGNGVKKAVEARNMEPTKCKGWEWVGWDEMRRDWEGRGEVGEGTGRADRRRRLFRPLYDLFEQRPGFSLEDLL